MWPQRSHLLASVIDLTGKGTFEWLPKQAKAFNEIKSIYTSEVLQLYPDHNCPFAIYTNTSNHQLGGCIMQDEQPVSYCSKKLNTQQQRYNSAMEKELLLIVYTLSEFCSMILGANLTIYIDHKNLTYNTLNNLRGYFWRNITLRMSI